MVEEIGPRGDHVCEGRVVLEILHEGEDCQTQEGALNSRIVTLAIWLVHMLGKLGRMFRLNAGLLTIVITRWKLRLCQNQCDHVPSGAIRPGYSFLF